MLLPAAGWAINQTWLLRDLNRKSDLLIKMHNDPDRYGFGTMSLTIEMKRLVHYNAQVAHFAKWQAEQTVGKTPPPFVGPGEK